MPKTTCDNCDKTTKYIYRSHYLCHDCLLLYIEQDENDPDEKVGETIAVLDSSDLVEHFRTVVGLRRLQAELTQLWEQISDGDEDGVLSDIDDLKDAIVDLSAEL